MTELIKEAKEDAKMILKIVKLRTSFLGWMTNQDKKEQIIERTKQEEIDKFQLRETLATAYNDDERQVWWKAFYAEYARLNEI